MMRVAAIAFWVLIACKTPTQLPVAYTLRGKLSLVTPPLPPNLSYADEQFGGDVHVIVYSSASEGYCLRGSDTIESLSAAVVRAPSIEDMRAGVVEYAIERREDPNQTYPFDIYPSVIWQATSSPTRLCEERPDGGRDRINALGLYGVPASDLERGPTSPCCGFTPKKITIESPGTIIDADFVLAPAVTPFAVCPAADEPIATCSARHAPGNAFADSACYEALGSERETVFPSHDENGELNLCPPSQNGFTLKGTVRFPTPLLPPGLSFSDAQFGGQLAMAVYDSDAEGFCLRGADALLGVGPSARLSPTISDLRATGVVYTTEVTLPPDQTYPLRVYASVFLQRTLDASHPCETTATGTVFNALSVSGYSQLDYLAGPTSACCGFRPLPIVVHGPGEVIANVDFTLIPAGLPTDACPQETERTSYCALRQSVCGVALGPDSTKVFSACR